MKRFFTVLIAAVFLLGIQSCSNDDDDTSGEDASRTFSIALDTAGMAVVSESDQTMTTLSNVQKAGGEKMTAADIPSFTVRNGYTFKGWYLDPDYSEAFFEFTVSENKTLYAKFADSNGNDVKMYKVSYSNPETPSTRIRLTSKYVLKNIANGVWPTSGIDGKLFCGWYYDSTFTKPFMTGGQISADTTVYAKWIDFSDLKAGTGGTFVAKGYDDVSDALWYKRANSRSGETYKLIGDFIYEETDSWTYSSASHYYKYGLGIQKIENALFWNRVCASNKTVHILSDNTISQEGILVTSSFDSLSESDASVDMTKLSHFAMVTATGAGTVRATVCGREGDNEQRIVALVDSNGKILSTVLAPKKDVEYTLSANVSEAGNIFLINAVSGGNGIGIVSLEFAESANPIAGNTYIAKIARYNGTDIPNGSTETLVFATDGTFQLIGTGSGISGSGTYTVNTETRTISFSGELSGTATYTADGKTITYDNPPLYGVYEKR